MANVCLDPPEPFNFKTCLHMLVLVILLEAVCFYNVGFATGIIFNQFLNCIEAPSVDILVLEHKTVISLRQSMSCVKRHTRLCHSGTILLSVLEHF